MLSHIIPTTLGIALAVGIAPQVFAEGFPAPVGTPVLTISGDIGVTNVGDTLVLDRETLTALAATSFETSTIWTDGVHTFTGVSLKTLVDEIGAEGGRFLATAINDYTVEIPAADAIEGGPIIAYSMDGEEMSVRDKGPLWVLYPYDNVADYRAEVVYARSIWQLDKLKVVK